MLNVRQEIHTAIIGKDYMYSLIATEKMIQRISWEINLATLSSIYNKVSNRIELDIYIKQIKMPYRL